MAFSWNCIALWKLRLSAQAREVKPEEGNGRMGIPTIVGGGGTTMIGPFPRAKRGRDYRRIFFPMQHRVEEGSAVLPLEKAPSLPG